MTLEEINLLAVPLANSIAENLRIPTGAEIGHILVACESAIPVLVAQAIREAKAEAYEEAARTVMEGCRCFDIGLPDDEHTDSCPAPHARRIRALADSLVESPVSS